MQAQNPSHACALVMVDELVRCGTTDAVLAPGSRSTALALALHDEERIRLHVEIDERSAGFLALGLGRATGRPAPVVVTSGTAVANLHPAVVEADTGRVPLLLLTADRPPELRHTGANQTIDQLGLFGGAVRWHVELGVPEDRPGSNALWRSTIARAVAETRGLTTAAGPVHINLPFREPTVPLGDDGRAPAVAPFEQPIEGRPDGRAWVTVERAERRVAPERLDALARRIATTSRGLLVVGTGEVAPEPLLALSRAAGWPLVAEATSSARSGPHAIAHAPLLLADDRFASAMVPDLVLRIGRTGLSREVEALLAPEVPQLLVAPDGRIDDPARGVADVLVADAAAFCRDLADRLAPPEESAYLQRWRSADRRAAAAIDAVLDAEEAPSEPRTARDLGAHLPAGATLVVASSMPVRDLDRFLSPREGLRVVANRGASGIDGFVSTTLGVALGSEQGPVVALTGDLSFLHDGNGFLVAADAPLDVTFVVVDNDGGGIFSFLPQAAFTGAFERVFGTPHGRDLGALAAFHRLGYHPVTHAAQLAPLLDGAIAAGGIHLVHVRTERAANLALHRRITAAVGRTLDPAPEEAASRGD